MLVTEIFQSIQGESTRAGLPCTFVRLCGCNLRCTWCDTRYAYDGGEEVTIQTILSRVAEYPHRLVEITGGEPLCQEQTPELCRALLDKNYSLLLETNGTMDIGVIPKGTVRIMDVKCPSSGCESSTEWSNLSRLTALDEVKCVIADRRDFDYAVRVVLDYRLPERCSVLFSPLWNRLPVDVLAEWILKSHLPIRLQVQLHKIIWGEMSRK